MLSQITVRDPWGQESIRIKISTREDLMDYTDMTVKDHGVFINKVIKSDVPPERWDHIHEHSAPGNTFSHAVQKCMIMGGSPIAEYSVLRDERLQAIERVVTGGDTVIVNSRGGWCILDEGYTVLKEEAYLPPQPSFHKIPEGTIYIILENDPEIEEYARETIKERDPNFSTVENLRSYSESQLVGVLKEFVEEGGEILYVYTTGMDVQQMYSYSKCALAAGIDHYVFDFNSGMNEDISAFIEWLSFYALTVDSGEV